MKNIIKQYFYTSGNIDTLINKNIFGEDMSSIRVRALGIQSLPGTKFYLNESDYPLIIGATGLFEIPFSSNIIIASLRIENKSIEAIKNNPSAVVIIDTIQESSSDDGLLNNNMAIDNIRQNTASQSREVAN